MIQKFKMTTFAAVLCLFGFMLFSAAPVYADRQENFQECKDMKWTEGKKAKKNCFRDLAKSYPRSDLKKSGLAVCKGMTWGEEKGDKKLKTACFGKLVGALGSQGSKTPRGQWMRNRTYTKEQKETRAKRTRDGAQ